MSLQACCLFDLCATAVEILSKAYATFLGQAIEYLQNATYDLIGMTFMPTELRLRQFDFTSTLHWAYFFGC